VWNSISELAQSHLIEIEHLMRTEFAERSTLEAVSAQQLLERLEKGDIILLDARPPDEFKSGHIPGAISVPTETLADHLKNLPKDQEIVAYCRTSYCLLSDELALILKSQGYNVRVLEKGMSDWQASGLPVERDPVLDDEDLDE
jgi:rhodanese-related sulfurtransferase